MFTDGYVVEHSPDEDEAVPDGVGEGDDAVTLKEDHPDDVDRAAQGHLIETSSFFLCGGESGENQISTMYDEHIGLSARTSLGRY